MAHLSISTLDQSSKSPEHYKTPGYTTCPSSPASPPYTPGYATPLWALGAAGSTVSLGSNELDLSSLAPNGTPRSVGHRTTEVREGGFPVGEVSAKMNHAESTSRELTLGAGGRGAKLCCKFGCGKKFSRKSDEIRHRRISCVQNKERQKLFSCGQCGTTFHRLDNLKQHRRRRTKRCIRATEKQAAEERTKAQQLVQLS